jgi:ADP-ribose pyrophosphatase
MSKGIPKPNGKIESIYKGHVVHLRREGVDMPDGRSVDFEVVRHAPATAILAIDDDDQVIFVHQFRHALGKQIWEIPAGIVEDGEEPYACAVRELREETGFRADDWKPLGKMYTAPGFCDEIIHLYLARKLTAGDQQLEANEFLQPHAIPLAKVREMINGGEIDDSKTIVALYRAMSFL